MLPDASSLLTRRRLLKACLTLPAWAALPAAGPASQGGDLHALVLSLEERLRCRFGVYVRDTGTGERWEHRAHERFPLNSTFKAFACGAVLAAVDRKEDSLERRIPFGKHELVPYSPVTQANIDPLGMRLAALCQAATSVSDNTAANLILGALGGPIALTAFLRTLGDTETLLCRYEPDLNASTPGDIRDTTTPQAAGESLASLLLGSALSPSARSQLRRWMEGNQTGGAGLRRGLPQEWKVADRTGAGEYGSRSVIAVVWPMLRAPLIVALYLTGTQAALDRRDAAMAEVGAALARVVAGHPPGRKPRV